MATPIDLYLLLGESNAAGYGRSELLPEALGQPHPSATLWWADLEGQTARPHGPTPRTWQPLTPGAGALDATFGPELSLAHTLAARSQNPIAIIKATRHDASLFAHWRPELRAVTTTLAAHALDAANRATRQLQQQGAEPRPAGVIFFQGPADTRDANPEPALHAKRLGDLLGRLRLDWARNPDLPAAVLHRSPRDHHPAPHAQHVKHAAAELAQQANAVAWIDLDDLHATDGLRLDAPSTLAAGDRAAYALLGLQAHFNPKPLHAEPQQTPDAIQEAAPEPQHDEASSPNEAPEASPTPASIAEATVDTPEKDSNSQEI
ncbi:MAG: sialate O-acetylesterase, partial [Planctomycetota bacterium]